MLKKKRALLKMSMAELEAVVNVISPGRFLQRHSKSDLQEEVIHWILENGLRVSHQFTLIEMDDGSCGVLSGKNGCTCCQGSVLSGESKMNSEFKIEIQ
uniref:Histone-lysine N-methyltransferase SETMAR n=1 Tax=Elaeophora elaphi TaxID=1147741 RepID=A0A0R3RNH4_9BILA